MKSGINTVTEQMKQIEDHVLTKEEKNRLAMRVISPLFAVALLIAGLSFNALFKDQTLIGDAILFIAGIIASIPIFITAIKGLIKSDNTVVMDQLISIALLAALAKGDFITVILIPFIMSLVHFLEERSILGAHSAIDAIKTLQAKQACLITENGDKIVPTEHLNIGDHISVKSGEVFPCDGKVIKGYSSVDQSTLTGETNPVDVSKDDEVFAGTVNLQGYLEVLVTKKADETSISKIVEIMQEAEQSKPPLVRKIDNYISYYTPIILIIAVVVLFITGSVDRVITVLVVSCPCALVLVSSTAMVSAISVSSKHGILIKNSAFLEKAGRIKNILFDKTGTITEGKLRVSKVNTYQDAEKEALLKAAYTAAKGSNHPVSRAIVYYVKKQGDKKAYSSIKAASVEETAGFGTIAKTDEGDIFLGKKDWIETQGINIEQQDQQAGTEVWVSLNGIILGNIILSDTLRTDAYDTITNIREIGIESIVMVTGDRIQAVQDIQSVINFDNIYYECLPSEKLEVVENEKEVCSPVMMIGDGVNDALAMVKADVSIAMGAMGSDIAIRSSDIALMTNDLTKIPFIIELSRKTNRVIYRNLAIAITTSAVMLTLAATGIISPIAGTILHNIGAILVIISSAGILNFKCDFDSKQQ